MVKPPVFPQIEHQLCIVHQIRNSLKFVSYKDKKALDALETFNQIWGSKYPYISKSWKDNWTNLIIFLEYPEEIRRIIYTTNPIESLNNQLRKVIKNKKVFPNDNSVFKIFYLAVQNIEKKWTMAPHNWNSAIAHFFIKFEGRIKID